MSASGKVLALLKHNRLKLPSSRLLSVFAGLAATVTMIQWRDWPAEALVVRDPPTRTDVAIVFAGDPGFERTTHAARLFRDGLTASLFVSGGEAGPGDNAHSLKRHAIELGVPEDKILLEDRSSSTWETLLFGKPLLEQHRIESVTLVTSPYHQRRAYLVTRRVLGQEMKIVNSPAEPSFWKPKGWWRRWRSIQIVLVEYGKLAYYFFRGWI
jgi:uncharacterized SAM-binding protein YcdF (DUF218 family)